MLRKNFFVRAPIGFLGLGQMGGRMATNLFKTPEDSAVMCTELYYYDIAGAAPVGDLAGLKMMKCGSPAEVARNCKYIVTMLPNAAAVNDCYDQLLMEVQSGAVLIDSSTIDVETAKKVAEKCISSGAAAFCDAPVSGGVNAAAAGTLTFMVGGPHTAANQDKEKLYLQAVEPLLKAMGKNIFRCGDIGSGLVVKLCNNLILGQHMLAVSEAMLLGTRLGVDAKTLAGCVNVSTGRCWSSELYNPFPGVCPAVPASNEYKGGFGSTLMLKDLKLALEACKLTGLRAPGAKTAMDEYSKATAKPELKDLDFSAIIKHLDDK